MNQTENRPLGFKGKVEHPDKVHEFFITEENEKLIKYTGKKHRKCAMPWKDQTFTYQE